MYSGVWLSVWFVVTPCDLDLNHVIVVLDKKCIGLVYDSTSMLRTTISHHDSWDPNHMLLLQTEPIPLHVHVWYTVSIKHWWETHCTRSTYFKRYPDCQLQINQEKSHFERHQSNLDMNLNFTAPDSCTTKPRWYIWPMLTNFASQGYCHNETTEEEHEEEISRATSERPLLQHPTVAIGEYHVEQEVESDRTKEKKVGEQSP